MYFEIIGSVYEIETIAAGRSVRTISELRRQFGAGHWRKINGVAEVRLPDGTNGVALHWYEAHGVGKRKLKLKRFLD